MVKRKRDVKPIPRKPRVLLAACGSIAATKFGDLFHCFIKWAEVRVVVSNSSLHFFDQSSLPKEVLLYSDEEDWSNWNKIGDPILHIDLKNWAEVMVIAPLSANTLSKIACGLCDNLLTCIVRSWDYSKPMFVAPAMNNLMWKNPLTEKHLLVLDELGTILIPPTSERLAADEYGYGSMADAYHIYVTVRTSWEWQGQRQSGGAC